MKKIKYIIFTLMLFIFASGNVLARCSSSGYVDVGSGKCCPSGYTILSNDKTICYDPSYENSKPSQNAISNCGSGCVDVGSGKCCPSGYTILSNDKTICYDPSYESSKPSKNYGESCVSSGSGSKCYYCSSDGRHLFDTASPRVSCSAGWVVLPQYTTRDKCLNGGSSSGGSGGGGTITVTLNANGGVWADGWTGRQGSTDGRILTYNLDSDGRYYVSGIHQVSKSGSSFVGWYSSHDGKVLKSYLDSSNNRDTLTAQWTVDNPVYTPPSTPADGNDEYDPDTIPTPTPEGGDNNQCPVVSVGNYVEYYTVTFNLDGGYFIDGSSSRTQVVTSNETLGQPRTNPIKKGYKFLYWALNGNKYEFGKKLSENITLVAVYGEDTENKFYCEDENDILDPSTGLCYSVLKTSTDKTGTHPFNFTTTTYKADNDKGVVCYAYFGENCGYGARRYLNGTTIETVGKNNKSDGEYEGYSSDAWREKDTCRFNEKCTDGVTSDNKWHRYGGCEVTWKVILYKVSDSLTKRIEEDTPKDDGKPSNTSDGSKTDQDAPESPGTGDALIYVAWIIGVGAIGYSVYYFKNKKENESTTW